jgi:predicted DNA-binding protein (UPF0251 family)
MSGIRVLTINEAARRLGISRYMVQARLLRQALTSAQVNDNPGVLEDALFLQSEKERTVAAA